MEAFDAYGMFLALRSHFTQQGYDYIKYNGKVRTNYNAFMKRNDRFFFHKLSKKSDPEGYVIANILKNSKLWITDLFEPENDEIYIKWKARRDSLVYNFTNEIEYLKEDFDENFKVIDGQHPYLLELYLEGKISDESMIILNEITGAFKNWNKKIHDDFIWPEIFLKLRKYRSFLNLDGKHEKLTKIIVDKFTKKV